MGLVQYIIPTSAASPTEMKRVIISLQGIYDFEEEANGLCRFMGKTKDKDRSPFCVELAIDELKFYVHRSGEAYEFIGRLIDLATEICGDVKIEDA